DLTYNMPTEWEDLHFKAINSLYRGLPMDDETDSRPMIIEPQAIHIYQDWARSMTASVNRMDDILKKEIHSGILGKMKEYCLRFAGILHISDKAYEGRTFLLEEIIRIETMERAIKLADYFYAAAVNVSERVNREVIASPEVIRIAGYVKAGFPFQKIGD